MGVGTNLKEILRDKKMTIKQLSEKAGIPVNTLYSITKRDSVRVDKIILNRLADALDVDAYCLMSFEMADDAMVASINDADKYKARITELMEKITTEGLRLGKDIFEVIAGNPKYQMYLGPIPLEDENTTPTPSGQETTPEDE